MVGVRECAQRIGGRLKVDSALGVGTALHLFVPVKTAFAANRIGLQGLLPRLAPSYSKVTISLRQ